ncbi:DUF4426 domain-containing protein [Marinobacter sp. V034]|uniref:DUF4426 domain-containing protein n=1 Tax=Marinobacter sp. V034 TaxID=3459610 RepID=UPI004043F142
MNALKHNTKFRILLTAGLLILLSSLSQAGQFEDFGDYQVHYSIFPSSFLTPDIAKQYELVRSKSVGIVNVSILHKADDGTFKPVNGQVEGKVINDIQQNRFLAFRRIDEGDAVYFIAQFQYINGELLTFELKANAPGARQGMPVRVAQSLVND